MSLRRPQCLAVIAVSAASLLSVNAAFGADKPVKRAPVADIDFLEYLGTLESDEDNWTDIADPPASTSTAPHSEAAKQASQSTSAKPVTEAVTKVTESK